MSRKGAWMVVAALALVALGFGLSQLVAQIVFQPDRGSDGLRVHGTVPGRFPRPHVACPASKARA